ncbi:fasciclin domain-containing protein [Fodinicurvata fenggangensis]|uniref:fasciclin domain-containing protein n=1 Tax=Fodinicurvata fenggangensis TaxID=1121830 RepID=UPI00068E1476|nr:fasciclin domain-containing protein [Fodinicurvata fenggangensis]
MKILTRSFLAAFISLALLMPAQARAADIIDTALTDGRFRTFITAAQTVGLVVVLKSNGPFTVLAPTDDAFRRLPTERVEAMLDPENKKETFSLLSRHIIKGEIDMSQGTQEVETMEGERLTIEPGETPRVREAEIDGEVSADNGSIRPLNRVLGEEDAD